MDTHRRGRGFEEVAARELEDRGWTILARNVRHRRKEVDLVVRKGRTVAFVEVKGRRGRGTGHPLEAITWRKRREIAVVARWWIRTHGRPGEEYRFDAVAVTAGPGGGAPTVEHVPDAWWMDGG